RGRRSRRRRRGGPGIPESKYVTPESTSRPGFPPAPSHASAGAVDAEEPVESAPMILPGESLRKYSGASPARIVEEKPAVETVAHTPALIEEVESELDEADDYPPENALPDAPTHVHAQAPSQIESQEDLASRATVAIESDRAALDAEGLVTSPGTRPAEE